MNLVEQYDAAQSGRPSLISAVCIEGPLVDLQGLASMEDPSVRL
jgi:hypothetical protein